MIFNLDEKEIGMMKKVVAGYQNIGLTSGTYDLLHYLHFIYLEKCRRQCDFLIVGIDSDHLVKRTKGEARPIIPEGQRANMIDAMRCTDSVFIMDSTDDFLRAVKELGVTTIFKNDAFKPEEVIGREYANVVIIPDVIIPQSTSQIVTNCKKENNA